MAGNVLVIGNCTVRQSLEPALEDAGYHVLGTRNRLDGLQELRKAAYRIVIISEVALMEHMRLLSIVKRQTNTPVGSGSVRDTGKPW